MDIDTYPKKMGLRPRASMQRRLTTKGKLDKHRKPNKNTPHEWMRNLVFPTGKHSMVACLIRYSVVWFHVFRVLLKKGHVKCCMNSHVNVVLVNNGSTCQSWGLKINIQIFE